MQWWYWWDQMTLYCWLIQLLLLCEDVLLFLRMEIPFIDPIGGHWPKLPAPDIVIHYLFSVNPLPHLLLWWPRPSLFLWDLFKWGSGKPHNTIIIILLLTLFTTLLVLFCCVGGLLYYYWKVFAAWRRQWLFNGGPQPDPVDTDGILMIPLFWYYYLFLLLIPSHYSDDLPFWWPVDQRVVGLRYAMRLPTPCTACRFIMAVVILLLYFAQWWPDLTVILVLLDVVVIQLHWPVVCWILPTDLLFYSVFIRQWLLIYWYWPGGYYSIIFIIIVFNPRITNMPLTNVLIGNDRWYYYWCFILIVIIYWCWWWPLTV